MGSDRVFLQARKEKIDVESKVGKVEVVDPTNIQNGAGYFCEVCACLLKDSTSYLDHINGKKRNINILILT
jgi:U4/U6.U5 tri-snRNP component SNU23